MTQESYRRSRAPLRAGRPALPPGVDSTAVVDALRRLPAEQRRALVLHHLADLTLEQVAAQTGAPVSTVVARLSQGRAALAVLLAPAVTPPSPVSRLDG